MTLTNEKVLVLNATYEPLNVCTVKRAIVLMLKEKAEVVEVSGRQCHSAHATFPLPDVIKLSYFVKIPRGGERKISRRAVFSRDNHRCQYCGSHTHLTIDHVIPRSRGGATSWENIVTSCAPCNAHKGDRLPREVGMHPRTSPRSPSPVAYIFLAVSEMRHSWERYLDYAIA